MKEQDQTEKSLVVRSEQMGIQGVSSLPQFREVGLTPQFFESLGAVNDAIVKMSKGGKLVGVSPLKDVSMELIPGQEPVMKTEFNHDRGLRIHINSRISGSDTFFPTKTTEVRVTDERPAPRSIVVPLKDIQEYAKKIAQGEKVTLDAKPNPDLVEKPEWSNPDLYSMTEEDIRPLVNWVEMEVMTPKGKEVKETQLYEAFAVLVEGKGAIAIFRLSQVVYNPRVFCYVSELRFEGEPEQAEKALRSMAELIDKSYEEVLPMPQK